MTFVEAGRPARGALHLEGFEGSGADWLEVYKPCIEDGRTVVSSPHKVSGPETNDPALRRRKRGIGKVILAGMPADLCAEGRMRELLEQGFEVVAAKDAASAATIPDGNGCDTALVDFRFMANAVWTTTGAIAAIGG